MGLDFYFCMPQLGLKEIFPGGAGMTLIQKQSTTHVSAAIQKAFIEVNEEGTTAAAASGKKSLFFESKRESLADKMILFILNISFYLRVCCRQK